jgi:anti-sigma-K factor RskA
MTHDELESLASVYAVGALDGAELAEFEAHLAAGCERCEAAVQEHHETLARVAAFETRTIPPADIRTALLRRLQATAPPSAAERPSRRTWIRWAIATAAAVVVGASLTGAYVAARYEGRIGQIARETAATHERIRATEAMLHQQIAMYGGVVDLLRDPATRVVTLRGLGSTPGAVGRVVWHPARGGVLVAANLPAAPTGKTYQLWTIAAGTPRPAGLFDADSAGKASRAIEAGGDGSVDVFAVTLEPAGGVPAPTGPMVLASSR